MQDSKYKKFLLPAIFIFGMLLLILLFNIIQDTHSANSQHQVDRMLFEAAGRSDARLVAELLKDGANVNTAHEPGNTTPLIIAAENSLETVDLLLKQGANPNWQNKQGKTALTIATYADKLEIVKLLIKYGANPVLTDDFGDTALMSAVFRGNPELVSYLVKLGADPRQPNKLGDSALDVAIRLVGYVENMDDTDEHAHHHHDVADNDHVVTDKASALVERRKIIQILE